MRPGISIRPGERPRALFPGLPELYLFTHLQSRPVLGRLDPFITLVAENNPEERQSCSKALECGSFTLWEIVACIKPNEFICLARQNPNV